MANGLVTRLNVENADLASLRDAYAKMQALSGSDNRSWIYWSGYHGFPQYYCWHHGRVGSDGFPYDLFLPWHRAYLHYFQNTAADQNPAAVLPWWDWTSSTSHSTGIPKAYSAATAPDGSANPLRSGPMPPMPPNRARQTKRSPGAPSELPTAADVDAVLGLTSFVDFSNQLQDIHDAVHGWVAGDMGVIATSAFDPVFWAHHCMIDRLWYLWQLRQGISNIPPNYLTQTLAPFGVTVADVLDIHHLGYEYAGSVVSATPGATPPAKAAPAKAPAKAPGKASAKAPAKATSTSRRRTAG